MSIVFIPPESIIPSGLRYLLRQGNISGVVALRHVDQCSEAHEGCDNCPFKQQCLAKWGNRVEDIRNRKWGGLGRHHVT